LHQCIRPLIGACCAPGHHGYQRAFELISGQASNGAIRVTSVRMRWEDRSSIVVSSSRRPRRVQLDRPLSVDRRGGAEEPAPAVRDRWRSGVARPDGQP